MLSSRATALARNSGGGGNVRSSRRRSENSATDFWSAMRRRISYDLPAERGKACADLGSEIGVRDGPELQERAVVLDGRRRVAALVGDDGEVVVRPGVARVEHDCAAQQIARVGHPA